MKEGEKDYIQSSHLSKSPPNPSTSHLSSHVQRGILTLIGLIARLPCIIVVWRRCNLFRDALLIEHTSLSGAAPLSENAKF